MNLKLKLAAYAVLLILAAWFAWGFYSNYNAVAQASIDAATNEPPAAATNAVVETTNGGPATNPVASSTNQTIISNAPATDNKTPAPATVTTPPPRQGISGKVVRYLAAFIGAIIALGLLVAHDVTQYVGNVAVDVLFDDRDGGQRDPEYEKAEQVWANGKHLDAIQMMRDFLKSNPRAQYAALRIAEIYEKDLHNCLAASMEYEDVLKQKLPPERWGWAAIHLCNLYSKLNQQDKAMALLQRIADEFPKTAAAKKARSRLGLPEPEAEPEARHTSPAGEGESGENIEFPGEELPAPEAPPSPEPPKSGLPPGFRPKK